MATASSSPRRARETAVIANWKCILICFAMSLANCQYGYDTATVAGFQVSRLDDEDYDVLDC